MALDFFKTLSGRPATTGEIIQTRLCSNTLTKWYNKVMDNHDELVMLKVSSKLVEFIEKVSKKQIVLKKTRSSEIQRIGICLSFLKQNFGIFSDNIAAKDIAQGNVKVIRELVFNVMEYFCIELPLRTYYPDEKKPMVKLQKWLENKIDEESLSKSWIDGKALGALINSLAPGLCKDYMSWDPQKKAKNFKQAMDTAEAYFGIYQFLTPHDMCQPDNNPYSMSIYLAQFLDISPLNSKEQIIDVGGPGIVKNRNFVNKPAKFYVKVISGEFVPKVSIMGPTCQPVKFEKENNEPKIFWFVYTPELKGMHTIRVILDEKSIGKSYKINVEESTDNLVEDQVTVHGPGIQVTGIITNRKTYFDVCGKDTSEYVLHVDIKEPNGSVDCLEPIIKKLSKESWRVEYIPVQDGGHVVSVFVFNSSYNYMNYPIIVSNEYEDGCVRQVPESIQSYVIDAKGDGLLNKVMASIQVSFSFKKPANFEEPDAVITDAYGYLVQSDLKYMEEEKRYEVTYRPVTIGDQTVKVMFGQNVFSKKVAVVAVGDASKVRLGPIKPFVVVGEKCTLEVNMGQAGNGFINCHVRGQSGSCFPTRVSMRSGGQAVIEYVPYYPGQYLVNVEFGGQQVPGGFFKQKALRYHLYQEYLARNYYEKSVAYGQGLTRGYSGQPCHFTIALQDDSCWPRVEVEGPSVVKTCCVKNKDRYSITYFPKEAGLYNISILFGNQLMAGSPYAVNIESIDDMSTKFIRLRSPNEIPLEIRGDPYVVSVNVTKPSGTIINCLPTRLSNGSIAINLTPDEIGVHRIHVSSNGEPVEISEVFALEMKHNVVEAFGIGLTSGSIDATNKFYIRAAESSHIVPTVEILGDGRDCNSLTLSKIGDGLYEVSYDVLQSGCYIIFVKCSGKNINGSPFFVDITQ